MKTASRITFALPPQSITSIGGNIFESIHPPSPQMPPTTTSISINTQTDDLFSSRHLQEKESQTSSIELLHQSIQTESLNNDFISIGIQYDSDLISEQHVLCRDLTTCTCVEQLVKTRQFLVDTTTKFQTLSVSYRENFDQENEILIDFINLIDQQNNKNIKTYNDCRRIITIYHGSCQI